jgi:hypothetical protein
MEPQWRIHPALQRLAAAIQLAARMVPVWEPGKSR